jgi:hypothetical protein
MVMDGQQKLAVITIVAMTLMLSALKDVSIVYSASNFAIDGTFWLIVFKCGVNVQRTGVNL